ncbi:hypothetical protein BJ912DRAFT_987673 [Pholiota molesta]|nr:hypothetical protein BJ912DRAFT_987673 [Pholiota molesta]
MTICLRLCSFLTDINLNLYITRPATTDDLLCDRLSAADLYRYARTCRTAHCVVQSYIKRAFQVHTLLERYFTPAEALQFRELQAQVGMFISGSTALQFLDRALYPETGLDLYVERRLRRAVALWLIAIGYTYVNNVSSMGEIFTDSQQQDRAHVYLTSEEADCGKAPDCPFVFDFEKQNPDRKIQVLRFHSSCVMNIITHDKAYSLYPRATFEDYRSLMFSNSNDREENALKKYASRGWTTIMLSSARYLGDRGCWTLPILPALACPPGRGESNSWNVRFPRYARRPDVDFGAISTKNMKFNYLMTATHEAYVRKYADALAGLGLYSSSMLDDAQFEALTKRYRGKNSPVLFGEKHTTGAVICDEGKEEPGKLYERQVLLIGAHAM